MICTRHTTGRGPTPWKNTTRCVRWGNQGGIVCVRWGNQGGIVCVGGIKEVLCVCVCVCWGNQGGIVCVCVLGESRRYCVCVCWGNHSPWLGQPPAKTWSISLTASGDRLLSWGGCGQRHHSHPDEPLLTATALPPGQRPRRKVSNQVRACHTQPPSAGHASSMH